MKSFCRAAALALATSACIALASPASASLQLLGSGNFSAGGCTPDCVGTFAPPGPESAAFTDTFTFAVTGGSEVLNNDSATNAITLPGEAISSWTLDVFHNASGSNGTFTNGGLVTGSAFTETQVGINQQISLQNPITLNPGFYAVELTGTVGGTPTAYSGSFSFSPVAAVPEPSTWAMLLLGFAGLAWAFKKKRAISSFA